MKKTAIYLRVSSDRQAKEGDSIPAQRDALMKYIDGRDDLEFAGEYLDDGISGTRKDRDALQLLLSDVAAKKLDLIIFTKLDRWFRSIRHYVSTQEILDKYGVQWLAIWEPIYDTSTAAGRLIVNQMMSIAQFEAENTSQRIRQVFAFKISQGEVVTGNVPKGYRIEGKRLVVVPEEADHVRRIFNAYALGASIAEVTRMSAGIPGFPRVVTSLRRMLKTRDYIGEHRGNASFCPPIIDRDLFERVQLQLSRNIRPGRKHDYLFSRLIRCACCGGIMSGYAVSSRGRYYLRYKCNKHFNPAVGPQCVNGSTIGEKKIEEHLIRNLAGLLDAAAVSMREEDAAADPDADAKRAKAEGRLSRLKDLYVEGMISLDEYKKDRAKLTAELAALEPPKNARKSPVLEFDAEKGINLYTGLETPGKRLFWRSIIKEIIIDERRVIRVVFL